MGVIAVGAVRWIQVSVDLDRSERQAAWEQIKRERIPEFGMSREQKNVEGRGFVFFRVDPHGTKLWLATGRDPNGDDCAKWSERPTAFALAILRPLGFCKPDSSDHMPFLHVVLHGSSPDAREAARLMIASGADVNRISPDGIVPLRSVVLRKNEEMVLLLLEAGADPLLKPEYSQIGDFSSALETAESMPSDSRADRIREMVRAAAERRRLAGPR